MAGQKRLGLYWGDDGLSLIEVSKDVVTNTADLPFTLLESGNPTDLKSVSGDARLLELLHKTVRNKGFSTLDTYLSFPLQEILVRWFVIPWMRPHEIQGVVTFEARKYIPFPLEDLVFTYYPSTLGAKEGNKQIGVLFFAIRKDTYRKLINILSQAGLNVIYSEPSSMSMFRALVARRVVGNDEVVAVLQVDNEKGEIMIASGGFVKFTRDFKLVIQSAEAIEDPQELLRAKLFSEVRLSLDFFNRQHPETEVDRVIGFASALNKSLCSGLDNDLGIPFLPADTNLIVDRSGLTGTGVISAFGAAMAGTVPTVIDFNLSEGDSQLNIPVKKPAVQAKMPPVLWPVLAGIFAILVLGGVWLYTSNGLSQKEQEIAGIKMRLGTFVDMSKDDIESKKQQLDKTLKIFQSLSFRSNLTPILVAFFRLMPEGMWFNNISVTFSEPPDSSAPKVPDGNSTPEEPGPDKPKIVSTLKVEGSIFLNDTNIEFEQVNKFVSQLKADQELSKYFSSIRLSPLSLGMVNNKRVTQFSFVFTTGNP